MSCGTTDEAIIAALMKKLPEYGLATFHVHGQSDGFIFNRIWAAIKRECPVLVQEGVAGPEDGDEMWRIFTAPGILPFKLMDRMRASSRWAQPRAQAVITPPCMS
jgi:3-hydroxybutyryl-CoA dehydrogenase